MQADKKDRNGFRRIANPRKINNRRTRKLTRGRSCLSNLSSQREKQFERNFLFFFFFFILKPGKGNQKFFIPTLRKPRIFFSKKRKKETKQYRSPTYASFTTPSFTILSEKVGRLESSSLDPFPVEFPVEISGRKLCAGRSSAPLRRFQRLHRLVSIKKITAEIPKILKILGCSKYLPWMRSVCRR